MWIYEQATGKLFHHEDVIDATTVVAYGYAGAGVGKNNPAMESVRNTGPLPAGLYTIGSPRNTVHSPYTLPLTPYPANKMFGRSGFLIHGDKIGAPGTASQGCVILPRDIRTLIWTSGDHDLQVISGVKNA